MTVYEPHPLDQGIAPDWASGWGEDRYGVFVEFGLEDVVQRMRWIRPGSFWMGSPEDEEGRDDDEVRHSVTFTRGLWLADTPCTQALWERVMGSNPSRFRSPERPVEQVSWEDCQDFCRRLGERIPGLEPRLPTEAEWEYACRAGTETATYAGDLAILGANHAPALNPIAWYGGNSGVGFDLEDGEDASGWPEKELEHKKAGSRLVAQKQRNPWGLYDMLGNVYEWCQDWYGPYPGGEVVDPRGLAEGSGRVFRGGSWSSRARLVRAAFRRRDRPSIRWDFLGFRLARGQV